MASPKRLWTISCAATAKTVPQLADVLGGESLAITIIAPPRSSSATIEALFGQEPDRAALTSRLALICALAKIKQPKLHITEAPNLDWLKKVSEDFPPLPIARWTIHGAQHRHAVPRRRYALQIDATSAFGTGEHPTTQGCLIMLDKMLKQKRAWTGFRRMLDVGCGSGILAMACMQSVPGKAVAVDLDPDSVTIARNNASTNGLQYRVRTVLGKGYKPRAVRRGAPYGFIMANIFAGPLSIMAKDMKRHLAAGGTVILSGLLTHQANRVLAAHRMQKIYLIRHMKFGEWSVLALRRRNRAECRNAV